MQKNLKLLNERLCQKVQEFHDRRQADLVRCVARLHTEIQSIDKFVGDSKHLLIDINVQVNKFNKKVNFMIFLFPIRQKFYYVLNSNSKNHENDCLFYVRNSHVSLFLE